jgi:hypothetical protein
VAYFGQTLIRRRQPRIYLAVFADLSSTKADTQAPRQPATFAVANKIPPEQSGGISQIKLCRES